jgi:multiple antibiotic resistance protein
VARFFTAIVLIVSTLFPIVNPLGGAPIFLALTREASRPQRKTLAWGVARNSFFLLLGSLLIGSYILSFFGISLPIVQVGGGLVLVSAGWAMLKREDDDERQAIGRSADPCLLMRRAFYPLTLPLTVGPGSIAAAITLGANAPQPGGGRLALGLLAAVLGALLLSLCVFLCYGFADRTVTLLGPTATRVMMRLTAFLLLCIGLQIVWNGVSALVRTL